MFAISGEKLTMRLRRMAFKALLRQVVYYAASYGRGALSNAAIHLPARLTKLSTDHQNV